MTSLSNRRKRQAYASSNLHRLPVPYQVRETSIVAELPDGTKVEYWPGSHVWRDLGQKFRGTFDDFITYLKRQK